jgi:hypothetical protein
MGGINAKRLQAAWNPDYLLHLLGALWRMHLP